MEKDNKIEFNSAKSKKQIFWDNIKYTLVPFLIIVVTNLVSWTGNQLFGAKHGFQPNIAIDASFPFVSWLIVFYFVCFPVSIFALFVLGAKDRKRMYDLSLTVALAMIISGIIYAIWPTEFPLEWKYSFLPENMNFFDKWVYSTWHTGLPTCLLPSQHCVLALACIIGSVDSRNLPWWYRAIMIAFNIMVIISTVLLKQHFILDFLASLAIMTVVYLLARLFKFGDRVDNFVQSKKIVFKK